MALITHQVQSLPIVVLILLANIPILLASSQIQLDLYTDQSCVHPSTENPSVAIPISECLVTTGLGSVNVHPIACTTGSTNIILFSDTACGTELTILDWFRTGDHCNYDAHGAIAALMLTCAQEDDSGNIPYGPATATSTIAVASVADAGPSSAAAASVSASAASTVAGSRSATTTAESAATSTASTTASSTPSSIPPSSSSSFHLATSDIVAIVVGLGVGIPTIIIGIIGIRQNRRHNDPSFVPFHYYYYYHHHHQPPSPPQQQPTMYQHPQPSTPQQQQPMMYEHYQPSKPQQQAVYQQYPVTHGPHHFAEMPSTNEPHHLPIHELPSRNGPR